MSKVVLKDLAQETVLDSESLRKVRGGAKAKTPTTKKTTTSKSTSSSSSTSSSRTNHGALTNDPSAKNSNAHNHQTDGIHDDNNRIGNNGLGPRNNEKDKEDASAGAGSGSSGGRSHSRKPKTTGTVDEVLFGEAGKPAQARQASVAKTQKMYDVWFDYQDAPGGGTMQISPIILDLSGNGKADITGANVLGNGKIDGATVLFDIDPSKSSKSYAYNTVMNAYSYGGYGSNTTTASLSRYFGANYTQGEWKWVETSSVQDWSENALARSGYRDWFGHQIENRTGASGKEEVKIWHFGGQKTEERERTEWLQKGSTDGFLVWDVNGDGRITSNKEMFGNFDTDGSKSFSNGYEKLSKYFDKNQDGKVAGSEMKNLKIWQDTNADGVTQAGELKNLSDFRITSLDARVKDASDMSADFTKGRAWNVKIRDLSESKNAGHAAGKGVDFEIGVAKVREENLSVELVQKATLTSGKGTTVSDAFLVKGRKDFGLAASLRTDAKGQEVFAIDLDGDGHISTTGVNIKNVSAGRRRVIQTATEGILLDQVNARGHMTGKKVSLSTAAGNDAYLAIDLDGNRRITRQDEIVGLKTGSAYKELLALDRNRDGSLSGTELSSLKLFRLEPARGRGAAPVQKLWSLKDEGISSIDLAGVKKWSEAAAGNLVTTDRTDFDDDNRLLLGEVTDSLKKQGHDLSRVSIEAVDEEAGKSTTTSVSSAFKNSQATLVTNATVSVTTTKKK